MLIKLNKIQGRSENRGLQTISSMGNLKVIINLRNLSKHGLCFDLRKYAFLMTWGTVYSFSFRHLGIADQKMECRESRSSPAPFCSTGPQ